MAHLPSAPSPAGAPTALPPDAAVHVLAPAHGFSGSVVRIERRDGSAGCVCRL